MRRKLTCSWCCSCWCCLSKSEREIDVRSSANTTNNQQESCFISFNIKLQLSVTRCLFTLSLFLIPKINSMKLTNEKKLLLSLFYRSYRNFLSISLMALFFLFSHINFNSLCELSTNLIFTECI